MEKFSIFRHTTTAPFAGCNFQFSILFVTVVILTFAFQGQAQIINDDPGQGPAANIDATRLVNLLIGFACWSIRFAIVAISIALVFYGILFLKSRGSPQGMTYAKKALTWGLVGSLVVLGVFTIILSISAILGVEYPIMSMFASC